MGQADPVARGDVNPTGGLPERVHLIRLGSVIGGLTTAAAGYTPERCANSPRPYCTGGEIGGAEPRMTAVLDWDDLQTFRASLVPQGE
jgi:hypothetical protein